MNRILLAAATLACAGFSTGLAEGAICDLSGRFPYTAVTAVIRDKAYFRDDNQKPTRAYVIKGDFVAIRNVKEYGTCVLFIAKNGRERAGWLDNAALDQSADPGIQDLPVSWIMVRNHALILDMQARGRGTSLFASEFSRPGRPTVVLFGTLRLANGVGPAFLATGKLNGGTMCNLSGVLLGDFLRLFSSTLACQAFAGIYADEAFFGR
jgi:hypothetical protein